mmetsp:Transcript_21224/g.60901  ORF Transcript_21224/g.60901 Transcript_21224/m.60901 type:complete len:231 (+) Transcript_21224:518-1210(+)
MEDARDREMGEGHFEEGGDGHNGGYVANLSQSLANESPIREHRGMTLDSPMRSELTGSLGVKGLKYWSHQDDDGNDFFHASTVYAANQIGEMPARIARRDRISAARSRIEELTEEGEEEESMWSRDGTMEREGRRLRVQLKALEEKDGVVVASEVYKKLCQWLVKAKGKSIDEIKDDKEIMSSGTFTAWFNRGQKLGKSRKWRENLSGYIEKGCTEPVGKKSRISPSREY